jgi:general secretion pathway protein J
VKTGIRNRESGIRRAGQRDACRLFHSRFPIPDSLSNGFSLIEVLIAVAVFAAMAAMAYGGLGALVRTRTQLAHMQDDFRSLTRSVSLFDRDLRQATSRSIRDNNGRAVPAFLGTADHVEFTRLGFANPQAEQRSNLERVLYQLDANVLQRGNYAVLDRAPDTTPIITPLRGDTVALRLRYLDLQQRWLERWPAIDDPNALQALPRAVEVRIETKDYGEVTRLIELTSTWPTPNAAPPAPNK